MRGLTERSEVTSLRPLLGLSEPTILALPSAKTNGEPKDSPFVLVGCAIKISNRFIDDYMRVLKGGIAKQGCALL